MWKSRLGWMALAVSLVFAVMSLLLVRPNDLVEFFAGFVGGSVPLMQGIIAVLSLSFFAIAWWLVAGPSNATRLVYTAPILLVVALAGMAVRELRMFSRTITRFTADGTDRVATVYRPRVAAGIRPAIVIVHGSGNRPRGAYDFLARRFAEKGFVVLNPDKRGVGDSPGRYYGDDLDDGAVIATRALETRAALAHIATLPGVDTARIGLLAISQGGWVISSLLDGSSPARYAINYSSSAVSTVEEARWSEWTNEDVDHFGVKPPPVPFEELDLRIRTVAPAGFDPRADLARMTYPTLWLFGEWDPSQPAQASIDALNAVGSRAIATRLFPEANHGLFVVRGPHGSRMASYAPGVWDTVFAWTSRTGITR